MSHQEAIFNSNLFVCTTQFHIFNCLNIALEKKKSHNFLLILDFGNNIISEFNSNKLKQIFDEIKIIGVSNHGYGKIRDTLLWIISNKTFGYKNAVKFNHIFIPATEIFTRLLAVKLYKCGTKIHYYEDGLESYDAIMMKEHKYKQDTLLKVLFGRRCLEVCSDLYVYEPNLIINNTYKKPIISINKSILIDNIDFISECFVKKSKSFTKKIIFLNAWFDDSEKYDEQCNYLNIVKNMFASDYAVKTHPNETRKISLNDYFIEDCGNFELANGLYDMSSNVFVSIISTACLTPTILFNRQPNVVFLYKIFMKRFEVPEWVETDKVISNIVKIKGIEKKVFIPESIDEFKRIMKVFQVL